MKKLAVLLSLAAVLLLSACGKTAPQTAEISFPYDPSTGYNWYAFQSSDLFEISSEYIADGGQEHFTLKPLKAGTCEVAFVYELPEEAIELGDTYRYQMTVSKDMQITVSGGTASVSGDFDTIPTVPFFTVK